MVILTLSKKVNQWLGPFLLHQGLKLRYSLSGGVIRDNLWLDTALLLPLAQRLISLEVHDETSRALQGKGGSLWSRLRASFTGNLDRSSGMEPTTLEEESAIRLKVLEKYLLPALVGSKKQWSSVRRWQFHDRLLKWARTEFLLAKHGGAVRMCLLAFDTLRHSPQVSSGHSSEDDTVSSIQKLPTASMVKTAFGMDDWAHTKHLDAVHHSMERIAKQLGGEVVRYRGGGLCVAKIPQDADLSDLSLEDILEAAGGFVSACGPFNALCEQTGIYQLWTREYVVSLGRYLKRRVDSYPGETIILDVGAGDGLLVKSLRDYFEKNSERSCRSSMTGQSEVHPPLLVATDDGSWSISEKAPVESLSMEEAMEFYADEPNRQVIVLCSWMPMDEDWTISFREKAVEEYILIGECDDGQCGDNWSTWGNPFYHSNDVDRVTASTPPRDDSERQAPTVLPSSEPPRYSLDGYRRSDIDSLLPHQFSRYDCAASKSAKTVSFRRIDVIKETYS